MCSSSSPPCHSQCAWPEKRETPIAQSFRTVRKREPRSGRSRSAVSRSKRQQRHALRQLVDALDVVGDGHQHLAVVGRHAAGRRLRRAAASRSALRRALKSPLGRSRRSPAMRSSAASLASSGRERPVWIGHHRLDRVVELLAVAALSHSTSPSRARRLCRPRNCSCLTAPSLRRRALRDLADALLLGEAHDDDAALIGRQLVDEAEELRALLELFQPDRGRLVHVGHVAVAGSRASSDRRWRARRSCRARRRTARRAIRSAADWPAPGGTHRRSGPAPRRDRRTRRTMNA